MPRDEAKPLPGTQVLVTRLGHLGDGLAENAGHRFAFPFSLPGDHVLWDGGTWRVIEESGDRVRPACPHFTVCGGCTLQHVAPALYAATKREWVVAALARQGLATQVASLVAVAPATRRRASLTVRKSGGEICVGFQERRGQTVISVPECRVLRPRIKAALSTVAQLVGKRLESEAVATAVVTEANNGLDLSVSAPARDPLDSSEIECAQKGGFISIAWNGEFLLRTGVPRLTFSGIEVELPSGAFVQATSEAEAALVTLVETALSPARAIGDFYAGLGPFSLALARHARIFAFEGNAAAVACLAAAARRATGRKSVLVEHRDLVRRPLLGDELAQFDAVVLDPPRVGAEIQVQALAKSGIAHISYVSCNPASFARDARILVAGGYRLVEVTPIDQFLWSHHVELMGEFARG